MDFIVTYFGLVFATSFFILGWYTLTRHTLRLHPDGNVWSHGYVFSWWSEFWEQVVDQKKQYYQKDALSERYGMIVRERPSLGMALIPFEERMSFQIEDGYTLTEKEQEYLQSISAGYEIKDGRILFLYELDPVYRFPEWVREPVSSCPVCMASVYGSVFWFLFNWLLPSFLSVSSHPVAAKWLIWPLFCITVSLANKWGAKKMGL